MKNINTLINENFSNLTDFGYASLQEELNTVFAERGEVAVLEQIDYIKNEAIPDGLREGYFQN